LEFFWGINACIFLEFLGHRNPSPTYYKHIAPLEEYCQNSIFGIFELLV
jgi:hypothetical protein